MPSLEEEDANYVVRFKIVSQGEDITFTDLCAVMVINSSVLDDKVLYKKVDDLPTIT